MPVLFSVIRLIEDTALDMYSFGKENEYICRYNVKATYAQEKKNIISK